MKRRVMSLSRMGMELIWGCQKPEDDTSRRERKQAAARVRIHDFVIPKWVPSSTLNHKLLHLTIDQQQIRTHNPTKIITTP